MVLRAAPAPALPGTLPAGRGAPAVQRLAGIPLPTRWGAFALQAYGAPGAGPGQQPHLALVRGAVADGEPVLVRLHSECLTGDVFASGRCDCGAQLDAALTRIDQAGRGGLLYLRQEGRGIGLLNKLHAYALQDQGCDTVEANLRLGLPVDGRDYGIGRAILGDLGVRRVRLLTNNPDKVAGLAGDGIEVVEAIPLRIAPGIHNLRYLETKRRRLGHRL